MAWTWKRPGKNGTTQHAETPNLTPPNGKGWVLDGKFGVGRVTGAGESPPRPS